MIDLTQYRRRATHEVRIGACTIGGTHPVAVQSMTNTDTRDIAACVAQIERIARAGAPIVRLTAQGVREAENLRDITERLRADGNTTALVADIHFLPEAAAVAAQIRATYSLLGLFRKDAAAYVKWYESKISSDVPEAVKAVAEERLAARARKDWAASDALRAKLAEMGYAVKDSKEGYTLTKNV